MAAYVHVSLYVWVNVRVHACEYSCLYVYGLSDVCVHVNVCLID